MGHRIYSWFLVTIPVLSICIVFLTHHLVSCIKVHYQPNRFLHKLPSRLPWMREGAIQPRRPGRRLAPVQRLRSTGMKLINQHEPVQYQTAWIAKNSTSAVTQAHLSPASDVLDHGHLEIMKVLSRGNNQFQRMISINEIWNKILITWLNIQFCVPLNSPICRLHFCPPYF